TVVTAALALALHARGVDAGVVKPVQSGALADDPEGDAALLKRWTGVPESVDEIAPYCFAAPLAPLISAELEGCAVSLADAAAAVEAVAARHEAVLVEGAGGLLVPAGPGWTIGDLAAELGLPLLVVARAGLGTVNHTALTLLAAFRVRRAHYGRKVKLNMLVNAKSGICPEDCGYCSQSIVSTADVPKYPMLSRETLVEGAREAWARKAGTYCIVASGRRPSRRELAEVTAAVREI